jgi:dihydrolipoamide dehydrogenase
MATSSTQLAVLGGGPGGYAAAFFAADIGLQVALIDESVNPGGVCLYRGCIPSKALLHVASLMDEARHAKAWGIDFQSPTVDLDKLRAFKTSVVERLTGGLGQLAKQRKVRYVRGRASIVDAHTFRVTGESGEETITFDSAIIATGSRPATVPGLSIDSPRVWDSTKGLDLPAIPKRLLVIGGGYIGLELGTVYAALGSRVSVVEMTSGLLPGADRDLVNILAKRLEQVCESIRLDTKVAELRDEGQSVWVRFDGAKAGEDRFDAVLIAVGRRPNSAIDGIDRTRVQIDKRGFIVVDGQRRTAEPSIFAIGDVVGEPMLAHKASHEARVAVEAVAGHPYVFEPHAIPAVVFTDPEIAWCGLTEAQARAEGREIEIARFPWGASGRAVTIDRMDGVTKLIVDPKTDRILGVGIVGAGAGELIAEGVLAVEMGANASDLKLSIHPHPTLSETLMEAAEVFFGQSTHIYRPKKQPAAASRS